jgi:hypothetical protein
MLVSSARTIGPAQGPDQPNQTQVLWWAERGVA